VDPNSVRWPPETGQLGGYVNINLKNNQSFYNFLALGFDGGETSASRGELGEHHAERRVQ
jgi:hypothetical protein